MKIKIEDKLDLKIAVSLIEDLKNENSDFPYEQLCELGREYKRKFNGINLGSVPGVKETRALFKSLGIDPTKHRPSSEALLNRALKDKGFFKINTLVDIANWCSLDFLLPICVYDFSKIKEPIIVRKGSEDEYYLGHNRRRVNLYNRFLVADASGAFGSPVTDSVRTAVETNTTDAFLVIFAPSATDTDILAEKSDIFTKRIIELCGGKVTENELL